MTYNEKLAQLDLELLAVAPDPVAFVVSSITPSAYANVGVGATMFMVKVFTGTNPRAVFTNVGDSGMLMFKNKKLVYRTTAHKIALASEQDRLAGKVLINRFLRR